MTMTADWHHRLVAEIGEFFAQDADARAVMVSGSVADPAVMQDAWSDVDIKVILADAAVRRYFPATDWLHRYGKHDSAVIGVERHDGALSKTLRVCLENYRRLDVVLVPESSLADPSFRLRGSLLEACSIVWSRLPDLARYLTETPEPAPFVPASEGDVLAMADLFWFQAAVAIGKVVRDDLLIGAHLALDLARTCLVLQMMRRDRELGTNVHRIGGWGNEAVEMVWPKVGVSMARQPAAEPNASVPHPVGSRSACDILDRVERSCLTFDTLAADLAPGYTPRSMLLRPAIDAARRVLCRSDS
jgi:streptomycin adenylyltransferase